MIVDTCRKNAGPSPRSLHVSFFHGVTGERLKETTTGANLRTTKAQRAIRDFMVGADFQYGVIVPISRNNCVDCGHGVLLCGLLN